MPKGKWLKQGEEITPSHEFMIENFEDGTSVLTISEVYPDDTGEIVYEAHNPLGVAVTSAELVVESVEGTGTKLITATIILLSFSFFPFNHPKPMKAHIFTQF